MRVRLQDPCPCGSGRSYRRCCRLKEITQRNLSPGASGDIKRLVLVFPPSSTATSPPMGVCSLKGHIERHLPSWQVKVLDLNLEANEHYLDELASSTTPEAQELLLARRLFRGGENELFLNDLERYLTLVQTWHRHLKPAMHPVNALRATLGGGPVHPFIRRHAELVLAERPDVVGISVCYTRQVLAALCLAREIRKRSRVKIIMGGTYFNHGVEERWRSHAPFIDAIVVGAGELALKRILQGDEPNSQIPGVIELSKGRTPLLAPHYDLDLDLLEDPDYSDLRLERYYSPKPVLPVLSSRGCYWHRCAFCSHYRSAGSVYQQRSIRRVVEELRRHAKNGIRHFSFVDSIISPQRFRALSEALIAEGLSIRYYAMAKPVAEFDRELLTLMQKAGCRYIIWGLESASQRVLDRMDKGTKVEVIQSVLEATHAAGISNHVFTMFGFPTETREEFQTTLDFLARNRPLIKVVHRTTFALEEHSTVFLQPGKFNIVRTWPLPTDNLHDFECSEGMNREQVEDAFLAARPFLRSFSGLPTVAGDFKFRDHALLTDCPEDFIASERESS